MPIFGTRSSINLSESHIDLQKLFNEVIKYMDCSIIEGHRGKEEQDKYYYSGTSKVKFPNSKHNKKPALAVDVVPYFKNKPHIRWDDKHSFYYFAGFVVAIAETLNIKVRWGGNWDNDDELHDQTFMDYPHWELI